MESPSARAMVRDLMTGVHSPPGSQAWFPGDRVELYVNAISYQLVRATISRHGRLQDTDDLTWTPRGTADLSLTEVTIPAGFTRR